MDKPINFISLTLLTGIIAQFHHPVYAITLKNNIVNIINETVNQLPVTFTDPAYQNPGTKFTSESVAYFRFNSSSDGSEQQEIWLLGSQKEKLQKINVEKSGDGPYIYEGEIKLPSENGMYYLSIKLKGKNSSFTYEQNIEITTGNSVSATGQPTISEQEKQKFNAIPTIISLENKQEKSVKSILFIILNKIINYINLLLQNRA